MHCTLSLKRSDFAINRFMLKGSIRCIEILVIE
jgi:hypothetical protein